MLIKKAPSRHHFNSLFRYARYLGFGDIHIKLDPVTELQSIIAIHNTSLGPAIGGCRCLPYSGMEEALEDVLRLAQMMSIKAAISDLPHGGAKAVCIRPQVFKDYEGYFESFGNFVEQQSGRYITAVDSGTSPAEMDIVARRTRYVTSTTDYGDPSPSTALGVLYGIKAAVKFKLNRDDLQGIHVALQGAGHVGYHLAKYLYQCGAKISISDTNQQAAERCVEEFSATLIAPEHIYSIACDVFSPCALGAVLNGVTIPQLKSPIVAGSANNQLAHRRYAEMLDAYKILYAPDFVINSGGLIEVATIYNHGNREIAHRQIENIYDTMLDLFARAKQEHRLPVDIAMTIALEKLRTSQLRTSR